MKRCLVRIFSVPNALLPSCRSPYPSLPENRHENHRENTGISDKTNYFYYIYLRLYRFRLAILERRIAENCEPDRRGSYLSQQHPNNILYHENRIHTCRQSETPDGLSIFRQKIRRTRIQSELRRASFHITPSREPISSPLQINTQSRNFSLRIIPKNLQGTRKRFFCFLDTFPIHTRSETFFNHHMY